MQRLSDFFDEYSAFHRIRGNQLTHYVGIPMIVLGLLGLLAQVVFFTPTADSLARFDLGISLWLGSAVFYWMLDWRLGVPFSLVTLGFYFMGRALPLPAQATLFVVGWILQLVGHHFYEKRKPAFVDNLLHLFVGPLWIFAKLFKPIS